MPTTTGYENRLRTEAPHLSKGQVKKLAHRLAKRADRMQEQDDLPEEDHFFEGLRILGIITDTTARDADKRIETRAALRRMGVAA